MPIKKKVVRKVAHKERRESTQDRNLTIIDNITSVWSERLRTLQTERDNLFHSNEVLKLRNESLEKHYNALQEKIRELPDKPTQAILLRLEEMLSTRLDKVMSDTIDKGTYLKLMEVKYTGVVEENQRLTEEIKKLRGQ